MTPVGKYQEQGERLRQIREHLGITREEMAKHLRLCYSTLKNAELGLTKLGMRAMDDAERLGRDGLVAEDSGPYHVKPPRVEDQQQTIQATLNLAMDPAVRAAAKALSAAISVPESEALAVVIREKLSRG